MGEEVGVESKRKILL
jgi:hypothetical protein